MWLEAFTANAGAHHTKLIGQPYYQILLVAVIHRSTLVFYVIAVYL